MPLKITIEPGEIYDFVKQPEGVDDAAIKLALDAAIYEAEIYLNTDFSTTITNPDGTTTTIQNEAPPPVKEWVFNRVVQKYENRGQAVGQFATATPLTPDFSMIEPFRVYPFRGV